MGNLSIRFEEAGVVFTNWTRLVASMRGFAESLDTLPSLMRKCGVALHVIERRRPEIERLAGELRAMKST
jgi:hypothetical protein